jgi:hypothetical protein
MQLTGRKRYNALECIPHGFLHSTHTQLRFALNPALTGERSARHVQRDTCHRPDIFNSPIQCLEQRICRRSDGCVYSSYPTWW